MQPETFMPLPGPQPERRGKNLVFLAHFGLGDCTITLQYFQKMLKECSAMHIAELQTKPFLAHTDLSLNLAGEFLNFTGAWCPNKWVESTKSFRAERSSFYAL